MKQNRVFIILVSLMLLLSFSGMVGASTITQDSSDKFGKTDVVFVHDKETYIITIPESISLGAVDVAVPSEISATSVVLDSKNCLNVTVKSANEWKVINNKDSNQDIPYLFEFDKNAGDNFVPASGNELIEVMHISAGTDTATTPLKFTRLDTAPSTGTYNDQLTFYVAVYEHVQSSP